MIYAIGGLLGALIKDIIEDNIIELPKITNGKILLGSLGGLIIGTIIGYFVDQSFLLSFLAGYSYKDFLNQLLKKHQGLIAESKTYEKPSKKTIIELIQKIAKEYNIDWQLVYAVAYCESKLNPYALNINNDGSRDRGLFQINSKYHYYISDEEAFSVEKAIRFFCEKVKQNQLYLWNNSKHCWAPLYEKLKKENIKIE